MSETTPVNADEGKVGYGPEPSFPWVLTTAWVIFAVWGFYYVCDRLIPAYEAWKP
jgi:hypothetical protein